ncbi:MAG: type II toxin-antitoxin system HigB family toxin [Planctomycetia bacterium]|nr:type II toxin-antitoxin system HigB family toxin [Planctomycetia bacterium]
MHVIARPRIAEAAQRHPAAREWLESWWRVASAATWEKLADVRRTYPSTDQVGKCLVFDKGNNYRLVVRVSYANAYTRGTLLVKHFLTHAEYSKDFWKGDCYDDRRSGPYREKPVLPGARARVSAASHPRPRRAR